MSEQKTETPAPLPAWAAALPPEPLLIHDVHAQQLASVLARHDELIAAPVATSQAPRYATSDNGVAVINIVGPLVNLGDRDLSRYGVTSYGYLVGSFERAAVDKDVRAVVLAVNSPGGVAMGIDNAVDALRNLKAAKPVTAHVEGMAASGGYWLASQANEITMTEMSSVGSIGAYCGHIDISGLLSNIGLKVSLISSGRTKVDGNPYEALSERARAEMQDHVDNLRHVFAEEVALGRGDRLTAAAAMATEAKMFRGHVRATKKSEAIEHGLADRVGTLKGAISAAAKTARLPARSQTKGPTMTTKTEGENVSQADHATAVSAAQKGGATTERERFASVMKSEHYAGREAAASHMLTTTDMSAESICGVLAGLPKAEGGAAPAAAPAAGSRSSESPGGLAVAPAAGGGDKTTKTESPSASWGKAIAAHNAKFK